MLRLLGLLVGMSCGGAGVVCLSWGPGHSGQSGREAAAGVAALGVESATEGLGLLGEQRGNQNF